MSAKSAVNLKILVPAMLDSVKHLESIYGPVFSKMVAKFATQFEAGKLNDPSPPLVEKLQDCVNYVMQNIEKYSDGFCAIVYGSCKAENNLQGGIGSGGRTSTKQGMSEINIKTGAASAYNKTINTAQVCRAQLDLASKMSVMVGETEVSGNDDSATVTYKNCRFADACETIYKEGIRRVGGGLECTNARAGTSSIELATKCTHDFEVIEFKPPKCTFRIYKV
jgi:hypothetical protein